MSSTNAEYNGAKTPECVGEPVKLLRRIGSTTVMVTVHFSNAENETLESKLLRLMEKEVRKIA
jgi:hypothetical protein